MFACPSIAEESIERVVVTGSIYVPFHPSVWPYTMFQAVQLPAGIAHLDPGLADVDAQYFSLKEKSIYNRTSVARTLMARLLCLTRTRFEVPAVPYMRLLWSNVCIYVFVLLFSFSCFSDRPAVTKSRK